MIRVLVVEDQELYRSGVVAILRTAADIDVVGEACEGRSGLVAAERLRPDVALVDLRMPGLGGVELIRRLGVGCPGCRAVVLTTFQEDGLIFDALRAGAVGYLLKDLRADALLDAVRRVARGEAVLTPSVTSRVLSEFVRLPPAAAPSSPALSAREREVLRLLARGASNKEMAASLHLSEGTVKNHLTSLYTKLGAGDRTQAALAARAMGLFDEP